MSAKYFCDNCGEEIKLHAAYDRMMSREERRERIRQLIRPLAFWRRWRKPEPIDDDIPF